MSVALQAQRHLSAYTIEDVGYYVNKDRTGVKTSKFGIAIGFAGQQVDVNTPMRFFAVDVIDVVGIQAIQFHSGTTTYTSNQGATSSVSDTMGIQFTANDSGVVSILPFGYPKGKLSADTYTDMKFY